MKREEITPIGLQIKHLSKKFKCLSRDGIRIIHQFCQYDFRRTTKVMTMMEDMKNPSSFIQTLVKRPEASEELLTDLEHRYVKRYGEIKEEHDHQKEEEQTQEAIQKIDYVFFEFIHDDTVHKIMSFLDPYSFAKFSFTCREFHKLSRSEAQADYYKILCTHLFSMEKPKLPWMCRFQIIRDYVLQRPLEYRPNTRNAVQNNLRNYIWKMDPNSMVLQPSYYKSFGSYQKMFKECPKVNLNGYYILREKYVRLGLKDQKNPVRPINVIYYYRYLRFLQDGSVIYHVMDVLMKVRNQKLKPEQILTVLSKEVIEDKQHKQTMIGQYIHFKDKVYVKAAQSRQIFSYEFQIRSTNNQINNQLKIINYTLQLIDDQQQILQTLFKDHPNKEHRSFSYIRNDDVSSENSPLVQANSL